jgi:hypothetical protein
MTVTSEEVNNQLAAPQRMVAEVLEERWDEVREVCKYSEGDGSCGKTKRNCGPWDCPYMRAEEGDG